VPVFADEIDIHGTLLVDAVHEQPCGAVIATDRVSPALPTFWLVGAIEYVHPPSCVTVNVWPLTVMVALRCAPVFGAALNATVPLPLPDAPLVSVSQLVSLLAALQPHPSAVRTSNVPVPPPARTDADVADSENAHPCP
jgi:hypothetical protein